MRAAASRTFCTAGSSRPMSTAMMAITTKSSISVKPGLRREGRANHMTCPPYEIRRTGEEDERPPAGPSFQLDVERLRTFPHRQAEPRCPGAVVPPGHRNDLFVLGNKVLD